MKMSFSPESSSVIAYGWGLVHRKGKPTTVALAVVFNKGKEYHYFDVPLAVYEKLQKAESKGQFINSEVKGKYEHEFIGEFNKGEENV